MRINTVKKSRKSPGSCCRCGRSIEKGEGYKWVQAYRGPKRCFCTGCELRASDTTTGRLSEVYAAQEAAYDAVAANRASDGTITREALSDCLMTLRDEIQRIGEEYQEAADAVGEHFDGSEQHQELENAAGELDTWASQIDDAISELEEDFPEDDDGESAEEQAERFIEWHDDICNRSEEVINDCPL
jgi:hypothetical protein